MNKTDKKNIEKYINNNIRKNYQTIKWSGNRNIIRIIKSTALLNSDFQFTGKGDYHFGGLVEVYEKINLENDVLSKIYTMNSNVHIDIDTESGDIKITIKEPILLAERY